MEVGVERAACKVERDQRAKAPLGDPLGDPGEQLVAVAGSDLDR